MPYIEPARRPMIDNYLATLLDTEEGTPVTLLPDTRPQHCGELNYAFTMICLRHTKLNLDHNIRRVAFDYLTDAAKELRYQRINDVAGALACAALEIEDRSPNRRFEIAALNYAMRAPYQEIAVAYERGAILKNGDIAEFGSEVLDQRRVMKLALNAINGHLSMAYSSAESALQLNGVRNELRAILKE